MASDEQSKQNPQETGKSGTGSTKTDTGQGKQTGAQSTAQQGGESESADAVTLLKNDHREVEKLFAEYEKATNRSRKQSIIQQVAQMLKIHSELEEKIFYPAVRQQADDDDKLDEAQVEHDTVKLLINDLEGGAHPEFRDAKFKVLSEYVKHHVQEEEAGDGILEQGRKGGLNLKELGQQMAQLKQELQADPSQLRAVPVSMGQFGQMQEKENTAMRQGYDNGNSRGSRGRDDRERDDQGRFTSGRGSDDDGRRSSRGRGYDDDDRGGSSRSGRGGDSRDNQGSGWYGDSRGHSEAARRGWESRDDDRSGRGGSSRSGSSSGRDYDDDRGGSRGGGTRSSGRGGWLGDPEGHAEASRRGWESRDDDDRGGRSGGGRSGSSRSSRDDDDRGYYRSRQDEDDDRRYRSRSRNDDDDGRDHGRGGWFGDSRGHSEAARRGWEDRR